MKKIFLLFFVLLSFNLFSDDGSWSHNFNLQNGPIYSEKENSDIILEKEILKFNGNDISNNAFTEALFLFKNTSEKDITIDAGFPVKVVFHMGKGEYGYCFYEQKYSSPNSDNLFIKIFAGHQVYNDEINNKMEYDYPGGEIYLNEDALTFREQLNYDSFKKIFGEYIKFDILHDNNNVNIEYVIIESIIDQKSENGAKLLVNFHFKHKLQFKKSSYSKLEVKYSSYTRTYGDPNMGDGYSWDYILGTGGTWKDSIKKLYFVIPDNFNPSIIPEQLKYFSKIGFYKIYIGNNYEPEKNDNIVINYSDNYYIKYELEQKWFDNIKYLQNPTIPSQDFVTVLGASSFINDKTTIYTKDGVIKDSNFLPNSLFDGIRESSWCEGKKNDGLGEWVEFKLKYDIMGFSIQNGFNKSFYNIWNKDIHTYFEKNNRVKILEIVSKDEKIKKTILLKDIKDLQYFNIPLTAGTYKVYIKEVYKGSKWKDTCLGEIIFYTVNPKVEKMINNDSFFKDNF